MDAHSAKNRHSLTEDNLSLKIPETPAIPVYNNASTGPHPLQSGAELQASMEAGGCPPQLFEILVQHHAKLEQSAKIRQRALGEARKGNSLTAIALFSHLIAVNPDSATDYNNRGLVYFQNGQFDQAIADYNRAIELNPALDRVYNNRANYYAHHGQLADAILDYETAIDLNPHNVRAWINQGITFREMGEYERAVHCFEVALSFRVLEGHIYAERGRTHHLSGDWNCAIADYYQALQVLPHSCEVTNRRSCRLRQQTVDWLDELLTPLGVPGQAEPSL
ncbi:MAG: tetratricopeptide repeat protein [Cyanobacteria bacterium P01_A01_bin.135]